MSKTISATVIVLICAAFLLMYNFSPYFATESRKHLSQRMERIKILPTYIPHTVEEEINDDEDMIKDDEKDEEKMNEKETEKEEEKDEEKEEEEKEEFVPKSWIDEQFPPIDPDELAAAPAVPPPPGITKHLRNVCVEKYGRIVSYGNPNTHKETPMWNTGLGDAFTDLYWTTEPMPKNRTVHRLGVFYHGSCPANFHHFIHDTLIPLGKLMYETNMVNTYDIHAIDFLFSPHQSTDGCYGMEFSYLTQIYGFPSYDHRLRVANHPADHCYDHAYIGLSWGHATPVDHDRFVNSALTHYNIECPVPPEPRIPRITVIGRKNARHIVNFDELWFEMQKVELNYTIVYMEKLTIAEQLYQYACNTDTLLAMDGAAVTLFPFLPPPRTPIILCLPWFAGPGFWAQYFQASHVQAYWWTAPAAQDTNRDPFNWECFHKFTNPRFKRRTDLHEYAKCQDLRVIVPEVIETLKKAVREQFNDRKKYLPVKGVDS